MTAARPRITRGEQRFYAPWRDEQKPLYGRKRPWGERDHRLVARDVRRTVTGSTETGGAVPYDPSGR
jgi:hypothetical protein